MDKTTKRLTNQIIKRGWYRKGQTLGEGVLKQIHRNWYGNRYTLNWDIEIAGEKNLKSFEDEIQAKDDETAIKAFHSLYSLDELIAYDIHRVFTKYILIDNKDKGK